MDYVEQENKMINSAAGIAEKIENGINLTMEDIDLLIEMSDAYGILSISTIWKITKGIRLTQDEIELFCFKLRIISAKKEITQLLSKEENPSLGM